MTRVLWLTPDKPENISVGRRRIADHLVERGYDVTLRGMTLRTAVRSIRERGRYDAVIGTTRAGGIAGTALRAVGGPPLVVDHVDPIRQFAVTAPWPVVRGVRLAENVSFRLSSVTLFVYEEERGRVERRAGRTLATDLGVEFDRFADPAPAVVERAGRELAAYDLREKIAIYVGGLEPLYNVEALLCAADHLDEWSLVVLGTGSLEKAVRRAHDGRSVVYLGTMPHEDIPGYLHRADVGVSLVDDPHTLKVIEYGAAGLATVQLAGAAEARFGDLVEYCAADPESIAVAVRSADERDAAPLREFARQFDYDEIADDYATAIEIATKRSPDESDR